MGPKNVPAACATKDPSWIDRMYMKLENMCVEVDKNPSMLLQETSKYVESQMTVVGANVKKLCTELIQDLLSPSVLSSEGAEKKPECTVHCKCNCVVSEKPKQKAVDTIFKGSNTKAGFEEGVDNFVSQKQDTLKEGDMKVETRIIEIAAQRQEFKVAGCPLKSEVSGEELNNILGQDGADYGEELNPAVGKDEMEVSEQAHEKGNYRECEGQLSLSKGSERCSTPIGKEQGESGQFEAYHINTKEGENEVMVEETSSRATVYRGEAGLAEQTSSPKENICEELGQIATPINNVAEASVIESELRNQEVKLQQNAVDETHARQLKGVSKICMEWHAADVNMHKLLDIDTASHVKMDANDAKIMYGSVFGTKDMEAEEVNAMNEIGGDLRSMYSYVFSELSRSTQEEDPMIMSDFVIEEDEEQSAHWFSGEDPRKELHIDNFSIGKPQQTECFVKEFDSDWELL